MHAVAARPMVAARGCDWRRVRQEAARMPSRGGVPALCAAKSHGASVGHTTAVFYRARFKKSACKVGDHNSKTRKVQECQNLALSADRLTGYFVHTQGTLSMPSMEWTDMELAKLQDIMQDPRGKAAYTPVVINFHYYIKYAGMSETASSRATSCCSSARRHLHVRPRAAALLCWCSMRPHPRVTTSCCSSIGGTTTSARTGGMTMSETASSRGTRRGAALLCWCGM
jgi:hypothetical protein